MKRIIMLLISISLVGTFIFGIDRSDISAEQKAIKKVMEDAYIKGFFLNRDAQAMREGFHPDFNILMLNNEGKMTLLPIAEWTNIVETRLKDKKQTDITCKYPLIDVTGVAAIVKIEIFQKGKLLYTDYMSLYKFSDGWKIVNKIYHHHK